MKHTYTVQGMTCSGCLVKVKKALEAIPGITNADIDLESGKTELRMNRHVDTPTLADALMAAGKYTIEEALQPTYPYDLPTDFPEVTAATYKPLILIVTFLAGVTFLTQFPFDAFSWMLWMRHFMAGFFIVFAFFKLLNLESFASSYSMYDIVAARWKSWGLAYPFVELALGVAYLLNWNPLMTNLATVVLLGVSSIGVIRSNLNKRKIKCACLGDIFNLPMSTVTIVEDLSMVAMALGMLLL